MTDGFNLNRQAILNKVHQHFIVERRPAGRTGMANCVYHGVNPDGRPVDCAIGIFDAERLLDGNGLHSLSMQDLYDKAPEVLCEVFGCADLTALDAGFLGGVQVEHDMAAHYAANMRTSHDGNAPSRGFDSIFIEELTHRLDRFAVEEDLVSPCTRSERFAADNSLT